jgi:hypothetical protein
VFREQVIVNARLVVKAFEETGGDELNQIVIALEGFAEKDQVVAAAATRFGFIAIIAVGTVRLFAAVVAAALGDIHFAADDGLNVALAGLIEEIGGGEEIAVVGNGHGRHLLPGSFIEKLARFASSVEQTEIRMNVKVNELGLAHGTPF